MITWRDVPSAIVPLYQLATVSLAYQCCSGVIVGRFVAVSALHLLSFGFISSDDPYAMHLRSLAADWLLHKLVTPVAVWTSNILSRHRRSAGAASLVTLLFLSMLPSALAMGISLLRAAMVVDGYGDSSGSPIVVRIVVLQSVILYYTLILFECRGVRALVSSDQLPPDSGAVVLNGRRHEVAPLHRSADSHAMFNCTNTLGLDEQEANKFATSATACPAPNPGVMPPQWFACCAL